MRIRRNYWFVPALAILGIVLAVVLFHYTQTFWQRRDRIAEVMSVRVPAAGCGRLVIVLFTVLVLVTFVIGIIVVGIGFVGFGIRNDRPSRARIRLRTDRSADARRV